MRGRWRGGHAATDEVDVGCALHDRRCGRCRSPSPAAACVIPCFQFSMLLHNLSSTFSLGKKASQRALRCTRVPHRTAATTRQPKASTTPAPAESARQIVLRPKARARPHPAESQHRARTSPLSALPHAPHRTAATTRQPKASHPHRPKARARLGPTKSPCCTRVPHRTAATTRQPKASAGPRPAESTHQAARRAGARPQRPERLETSFPHVFHIFAGFPQRLSFPLAFFERDRVRYALPYVPAVR